MSSLHVKMERRGAKAPRDKVGFIPRIRAVFALISKHRAQVLMAAAFFAVSLARCFTIPSPYALCCLAALLWVRYPVRGALTGIVGSAVFQWAWGVPVDTWLYIGCVMALVIPKLKLDKPWQLTLLTGMLLFLRMGIAVAQAATAQQAIQAAVSMLLGVISMPALCRGARLIKEGRPEWSSDDLMCLLLPGMILLAGMGNLAGFRINLGLLAGCLMVLVSAYVLGSPAAVSTGLVAGVALMVGGHSALMLACLSLGGIVSGLFRGRRRWRGALMFLLVLVFAMYLLILSFDTTIFVTGVLACLMFLLIPEKNLRKLSAFIRRLYPQRPVENAYTRARLRQWVMAVERMADALPETKEQLPDAGQRAEELTELLCAGCDHMMQCWHENYEDSKRGMHKLAEAGCQPELYAQVVYDHFSHCARYAEIPQCISMQDSKLQQAHKQAVYAQYQRDMLETHLSAMSQAVQLLTIEGTQRDGCDPSVLTQLEEALDYLRFPAHVQYLKRIDGHYMLGLQLDQFSLRPNIDENFLRYISNRLGVPLRMTQHTHGEILLEECPPITILSGMATACAIGERRTAGLARDVGNGDAVLARTLPGGQMLLALSDGMGHGAHAQEESKKTLELLSLCMEAGYTRAQAITAVNGMMLTATGGEQFATVDLCLVDLWTGKAYMNKLGACQSLLIQGQHIRTIEGAALPLGIVEHVVPMEHSVSLAEGDTLILMSDGITDAFEGIEQVREVVQKYLEAAPQRLADMLLQDALILSGGMPADDMTVLCARCLQQTAQQKRMAS